jgi:TDG/mug DNA glycosylase family protein
MGAHSDIADLFPGPAGPPLSVLFCGVNAPMLTVSTGEYFAQPGNRFWPALHGAGFTPRLLAPSEHSELARLGYGITKLVARSTARTDELTDDELRAGVPRLVDVATCERPRWIAFLGIGAFRIAFTRPGAQVGPQDLRIGEARVWVLHNPSGLNRRWSLSALITEYAKLRELAATEVAILIILLATAPAGSMARYDRSVTEPRTHEFQPAPRETGESPLTGASAPAPRQGDLFGGLGPVIDTSFATARRIELDETSWIEHVPGWLRASDQLFDELMATVPWEQRYRYMWAHRVIEPRLTAEYQDVTEAPQQLLHTAANTLSRHYGVAYRYLWLNLYRTHRDSTSWHGDPIGKVEQTSTVPVLSIGATRRFLIKPAEGGKSVSLTVASGDLVVMGGRSQRDWRHSVPKQATPAGPRISVNFAPRIVPASRSSL